MNLMLNFLHKLQCGEIQSSVYTYFHKYIQPWSKSQIFVCLAQTSQLHRFWYSELNLILVFLGQFNHRRCLINKSINWFPFSCNNFHVPRRSSKKRRMQDQWNEAFFVENSNIVISESTGCKYVKRTYKIWIWQLFWKIVTPKTWLQEEMQCENQISLLIQCGTSRLYWIWKKQYKEGRSVTWNKVLSEKGVDIKMLERDVPILYKWTFCYLQMHT